MSTTLTVNSLDATIPDLADTANIVTAFTDYHTSIANTSTGVAVLNRTNTFASNITFTGDIAVNGGDITTSASTFNLLNTTATTLNFAGATTALTIGATTGTTTVRNGLVISAGTSTKSPLKLTSGTNLSTISAGSFEYDGNLFYATPKVNNTTAGRGLLPTQSILFLASNNTQSVSVSSGTSGPTQYYALGKSVYLAASQRYFVEMSIRVQHVITISGSGSSTITFEMKGPTNASYQMDTQNQIDMTNITDAGTTTFEYISGLGASKTIKSSVTASDSGYSIFKWSGIVDIGTTAGNFGPALSLTSVNSGSSTVTQIVVQAGSYCKVTPLGTYASEVNIGGWA